VRRCKRREKSQRVAKTKEKDYGPKDLDISSQRGILYLAYIAVAGEWVGPLLWPAVVLQAVVTLLLARDWFKQQDQGPM
jgi:hypothetical protein